jgi:hypothetical protein
VANDFSARSDCLALYNFEDGALTTDSKGSNTLTAVNTPTADTTNFKQGSAAVSLAAASAQYLAITDANLPAGWPMKSGDTSRLMSLGVWLRPTTVDGTGRRILAKMKSAGNLRSWSIYHTTGGVYLSYSTNGTSNTNVQIAAAMTANQWYYLTFILDGTNGTWKCRMFSFTAGTWANLSGSFTGPLYVAAADFRIGADDDLGANTCFNGQIDELVIFNTLVNPVELAAGKDGVFPITDIFWHMDPVSGSDANSGATWAKATKTIKGMNGCFPGESIYIAKSVETARAGTVTATLGSVTLTTTNDLTAVCPQYTAIRIGTDGTIYMVKAVTSSTITLYRPYRGAGGAGLAIYTYAPPTSTSNDWNISLTGLISSRIVVKGGINTSNNDQDGFTVMYGNNATYLFGGTWAYTDISRIWTLHFASPWNGTNNYGTLVDCGTLRNTSSFGSTTTFANGVWTNFISELGTFPYYCNFSGMVINNLETSETGRSGMQCNNGWWLNVIINGWKNAGVAGYYGHLWGGGNSVAMGVRIHDAILDELNAGIAGVQVYSGNFFPDIVYVNPKINGGVLFDNNSNFLGDIAFQNVNGIPTDNRRYRSQGEASKCFLQASDTTLYKTSSPSSRLQFIGASVKSYVTKHFIPVDAGIQKTISIWVFKNSAPISTVTVNTAGSGYVAGDLIGVTQAGGGSAILQVATISAGGVASVNIVSGGYNYSVANALNTTTLTGAGSGAKINITAVGVGYGSITLPIMRLRWLTGTAGALVSNVHDETMPNTDNAWQQLSYAVTPGVQGVVVMEIIAQSQNTGACLWYDDIGVA